MPTTDALTSSAAGVSTATAFLAKNLHSLVSTVAGVSGTVAPRPYKVPTAGEITTVPYYDPAVE